MRTIGKPALALAVMAAALSGCGPHSATAPSTTTTTVTTTKPAAIAPPAPTPAASADCPYLDRGTAGDDNGQRVYQVKISKRVGSNPPACFFYRADGSLQLSVWVYVGSPDVAHAIVDKAAPVATSSKATDPAGWTGGAQPTGSGAVYAVTKGGSSVVVTTNQQQTIKAREIAVAAIGALKL